VSFQPPEDRLLPGDDERCQLVAETYGNWLCMDCFQLIEAFGAGTAAVVCPIKAIVYKDKVGP
jgi:hypothetical protein